MAKKAVNPTNSDILKKQMIEALTKSLGIVTSAAKKVGIHRDTHYEWMKSDSNYNAQVEGLQGVALDFAETQLMKSIQNGSDTATIFYLKTKGKSRGYVEKSEVEHTGIPETVIKVGYGDSGKGA